MENFNAMSRSSSTDEYEMVESVDVQSVEVTSSDQIDVENTSNPDNITRRKSKRGIKEDNPLEDSDEQGCVKKSKNN